MQVPQFPSPLVKLLLASIERYETALAFYADRSNYQMNPAAHNVYQEIDWDQGERARKALDEDIR